MATEFICDAGGLDGFDWDAEAVGLHDASLVLGSSAGGVAKLGGIVPAVGTPLRYVLKTGTIGTLKAGTYLMPTSDGLHVQPLVLPADVDITHTTSHASQPRTDLIIAELVDVGTSSSYRKFRLVTGQAAAGAPAPSTNWTTPGGSGVSVGNGRWVTLASVNVPANATTLGTITNSAGYTGTIGGPVRVASAAASSTLPEGTGFYAEDVDRLGMKTAAGYKLYVEEGAVGQRVWTNASWAIGSGGFGLGTLISDGARAAGTAPATGTFNTITITTDGMYAFNYEVYLPGGRVANAYIEMPVPFSSVRDYFDLADIANITKVGWVPAGTVVTPSIQQATGSPITGSYTFAVSRLA